MTAPWSFCVNFSGITIRFVLPEPVSLPDYFPPLMCDDCATPDAEYRVELLTTPLRPEGTPIHGPEDSLIYQTDEGWLRIYSVLGSADGCQVACLLCPDNKNILYYPASRWDYYSDGLHCSHLMAGEQLLLQHDAFLLHSSVVTVNGQAVLFSGPSGAGKSTQARLWEQHLGADILNGDRTVIMKKNGSFWGGGSIWSGTSGIFRREQAPVAGIFLVGHGKENKLQRLGFDAFVPLFSQTTVNSWDPDFMDKITGLFADLLAQVPVYRLECRPDEAAARLAYTALFEELP